MGVGEILGLHHVKVPVTDLARSRAWYERVFDFEPVMEFPDEDGVVRGVIYQPKNAFTLALRENPAAARGMAGFSVRLELEKVGAWPALTRSPSSCRANPTCRHGQIGWTSSTSSIRR